MPLISSIFASQKTVQDRQAICNQCDRLTAIKLCKECGCVIPAKIRLRPVSCPLGKWGPEEDSGQQHFYDDQQWEQAEREEEKVKDHFKLKNPLNRN
jgi:hypothetical protein